MKYLNFQWGKQVQGLLQKAQKEYPFWASCVWCSKRPQTHASPRNVDFLYGLRTHLKKLKDGWFTFRSCRKFSIRTKKSKRIYPKYGNEWTPRTGSHSGLRKVRRHCRWRIWRGWGLARGRDSGVPTAPVVLRSPYWIRPKLTIAIAGFVACAATSAVDCGSFLLPSLSPMHDVWCLLLRVLPWLLESWRLESVCHVSNPTSVRITPSAPFWAYAIFRCQGRRVAPTAVVSSKVTTKLPISEKALMLLLCTRLTIIASFSCRKHHNAWLWILSQRRWFLFHMECGTLWSKILDSKLGPALSSVLSRTWRVPKTMRRILGRSRFCFDLDSKLKFSIKLKHMI